MRGSGYRVLLPQQWRVTRGVRTVSARPAGSAAAAGALVSVTVFRLAQRVDTARWREIVQELDTRMEQLAAREDGEVAVSATVDVSGSDARSYEIHRQAAPDERLVYLFRGKREYQLFCRLADVSARDACDRVVASFTIS